MMLWPLTYQCERKGVETRSKRRPKFLKWIFNCFQITDASEGTVKIGRFVVAWKMSDPETKYQPSNVQWSCVLNKCKTISCKNHYLDSQPVERFYELILISLFSFQKNDQCVLRNWGLVLPQCHCYYNCFVNGKNGGNLEQIGWEKMPESTNDQQCLDLFCQS